MGMKNYKPVYDGIKFKTPMQLLLQEQELQRQALRNKEEEEEEDGNRKSTSGKSRNKSE